ncbi:MAG: sigma-54-dependent Fis family transcriptional regulator [candidate division Zixibacteria bacterium]|nr:sigma-54-dependent Fis family transcriptional regulator [candidate division Zixibacteria bacterium]
MTQIVSTQIETRKEVLIIDSYSGPLLKLSEQLLQIGCEVATSFSISDALRVITTSHPRVVLLNLNVNPEDSFRFLEKLRETGNTTPIVVISEGLSTETAIRVMKLGAYEYLPLDANPEKIVSVVNHLVKKSSYKKGLEPIERVGKDESEESELIGNSPEMVEIAKVIGQVAGSDVSVLIMGESGTGKELIAKQIFKNGNRRDKPFLSVNSAAIPDSLLESELFGHEKGSFTGAYSRKLGKFEQCNGGTIFLDEIADMSLVTQSKILRVLQEQEFERVGSNQTIKVDVRVVAATNKSLISAIKENKFRVDLYYRLKVVAIYLPPLRERKEDIPLLIDYFLKRYCQECNHQIEGVHPDALKLLRNYPWPGNVRELENNIHTAVVMCKERTLIPEHFPVLSDRQETINIDIEEVEDSYTKMFNDLISPVYKKIVSTSSGNIYQHMLTAMEKALYSATLKYCSSNQVKASEILGVSRNTLRDRVKKFGLY